MRDAVDHRRYPRLQIELGGWINTDDGHGSPCVIRDYCQGGLLVQLLPASGTETSATFSAHQSVHVGTKIVVGNGERPLNMNAEVVWVRGQHIGLSFARPSQVLLDVLSEHKRLNRRSGYGAPMAAAGGETRALTKVRHAAKGEIPAILRALMADLGEDDVVPGEPPTCRRRGDERFEP